jgi:hypothetical protein
VNERERDKNAARRLSFRRLVVGADRLGHQRTFTVRAKISSGDYAWIEVDDNGGPWTASVRDPSQHHGLDIVRALASECAIDGDQDGRTIWARSDWTA